MEKEKIISSVSEVFEGADERNWQRIQSVIAKNVLLDYTSMAGGSPGLQTPRQITDAWSAFLPGFDKTHHQLSDFNITVNEKVANAHYYGKADHFIGNEVWTVEGTYDTKLENENGKWMITSQKFNFEKQSGNTSLPAQAIQNLKN